MRVVKGLVIVMAVLIFVGMVAVVWAIFNLNKPADNRPSDKSDITTIADKLSLGLPAGCEIAGMELDDDRLAVRTTDPQGGPQSTSDCERIYIVDLTTGDVISTVAR